MSRRSRFQVKGSGFAALANIKLGGELNPELPDLDAIPGLDLDREAAEARKAAAEAWAGKLEGALRRLLPLVFSDLAGGEEVRAARNALARILEVSNPVLQARARWLYALLVVERASTPDGITLGQVIKDLTERGILVEGDWPENQEFRPQGYYLRLGKKCLTAAKMPPEVYREVRETVAAVFVNLRRLAEKNREERLLSLKEDRRKFREGANPDLNKMLDGTPGIYLVDVPPEEISPERTYPGGTLRVKSDGKSLLVEGAFGPFSRFVRETVMQQAGRYPLAAIARERLELGRKVEPRTFRSLLWLHKALRRGISQFREFQAQKAACLALAAEATVPTDQWLLARVPGRGFVRLNRFVVKDKPVITTYYHVGVIVDRGEGESPKLRILRSVNDRGLFENIMGKTYDEFSDNENGTDQPFSGCPDLLRRFLTHAAGKVARAREREALRRFAEGDEDDEDDESNGQ